MLRISREHLSVLLSSQRTATLLFCHRKGMGRGHTVPPPRTRQHSVSWHSPAGLSTDKSRNSEFTVPVSARRRQSRDGCSIPKPGSRVSQFHQAPPRTSQIILALFKLCRTPACPKTVQQWEKFTQGGHTSSTWCWSRSRKATTWVLIKEDNTQSCAHPSHESPQSHSLSALGVLGRVNRCPRANTSTPGAGEQLLKCTVSPHCLRWF